MLLPHPEQPSMFECDGFCVVCDMFTLKQFDNVAQLVYIETRVHVESSSRL